MCRGARVCIEMEGKVWQANLHPPTRPHSQIHANAHARTHGLANRHEGRGAGRGGQSSGVVPTWINKKLHSLSCIQHCQFWEPDVVTDANAHAVSIHVHDSDATSTCQCV